MPVLLQKIIPKLYGLYFNIFVWFLPKKIAQQVFEVFCTVRKGKVLPNQKQFLDDAKFDVITVAGHSIQLYNWRGAKETILLVHGWESNTWRWHKLIEKSQKANYNIIAFDAPAHGYSTGKLWHAPLYAEALQAIILKYQPKSVIGHSVGGMTVLYNEYKNPNASIEKIVTVGSPSEFHEILTHYKNLLSFSNKVLTVLEEYIYSRFGFTPKEFSSSKFVLTNSKKGLLFHDKLDKITPYHASIDVHKHWKGSELVSTEGFGHSMHQNEVNDKIIAFLAKQYYK